MPTRSLLSLALLASLLSSFAHAAPGDTPLDLRVHRFLAMHPEARAGYAAAATDTAPAEDEGHRKACTTSHPPPTTAGPVLASMRAKVTEAAAMDEDWRVFFAFYQHAEGLLQGAEPIPAGLCAALRGGLDGANETSTYASAAAVIRETYETILAVPHLFLGAPRAALVRGLQLHRDAARDLDPQDDRRRALKYSLQSYARCPDLVPHRPLAFAMRALGSASILPDLDDAALGLDAASAAVATLGDDPLATAYTLGLEAARASRTIVARYWFPYMLIDWVLQTGEVPPAQAAELEAAHDKAFRALETEEGVAIMTRILAEFAGAGSGPRGVP